MPMNTTFIGGLAALGLLALAGLGMAAASGEEDPPGLAGDGWQKLILEKVSAKEGAYTSLNLNRDNAGLSVGIIQWAQAPGQLGVLLKAQQQAHPEAFAEYFGGAQLSAELLRVTNASSQSGRLQPVGGRVLWHSSWAERFRKANADPRFQALQVKLATSGEHWQGAVRASKVWGKASVRSMLVLYDRSVQQGPAFVVKHAQKVASELGPDASLDQLLARFGKTAHAHFRRGAKPSGQLNADGSIKRSSRTVWKQVGSHWHAFAGRFDLYSNITRRVQTHLSDPEVPDQQVPLS